MMRFSQFAPAMPAAVRVGFGNLILRKERHGLIRGLYVNAVDLRVNGIDKFALYAMIFTFTSADKLTYNMRRSSISQQS